MAIAFNSSVDGGNNGGGASPLSFPLNNVAGDLVLACYNGDNIGGADDITSRLYNAVALSALAKIIAATGGDRITYIDGLVGPATGSHTLAITAATPHLLQGGAVSYAGAKQSGLPDNTGTNFSAQGALSLTTSITPVAANCWAVLVEGCYSGGSAPGASTGATSRVVDGANGGWGIFDSGGPITAGVPYAMTTTRASNPFNLAIVHVIITIAPAVASAGGVGPLVNSNRVKGLVGGALVG